MKLINYNKLHRVLVGFNCSIFWVPVKMRLPWGEEGDARKVGKVCIIDI